VTVEVQEEESKQSREDYPRSCLSLLLVYFKDYPLLFRPVIGLHVGLSVVIIIPWFADSLSRQEIVLLL